VIKVMEFADIPAVEREMMLVKVQAEGSMRGEILRTVDIFRCKVVDVSASEMIIEATGNHEKLEAIVDLMQRFGIKELSRTGSLAMRRSKKSD
ncbi:MAG: acetolactate synthase small subunit, partial [Desulfovibrio sp.]|nr:acetolactate synthase small subunit [Desulfovibrio sp.]